MIGLLKLVFWLAALLAGGYLLVLSAFKLPRRESLISGLLVGVVVETVATVLFSYFLPAPISFYAAALLTLAAGAAAYFSDRSRPALFSRDQIAPLVLFVILTELVYILCRGMGIFDDYAHLPTTSLIAAGDVPPHFALNRGVPYAYHYFLMIFAGQIQRIGSLYAWSALDLARAISFSLAVMLAGYWTAALTRNKLAGLAGGLFMAFGGGARWLLLWLPSDFLTDISSHITLIGSGASSGFTLLDALFTEWRIEGVGKLPVPFAFTNGIVQPGILAVHGANGLMNLAILLWLLLSFRALRGWKGAAVSAVMLASLSLVGEADLWLIAAGWGILVLSQWIRSRSFRLPRDLWQCGAALAGGLVLSLGLGGALVDIIRGWLQPAKEAYQSVGFVFTWPPSIVSAHLGVLSLMNPGTLLTALFEIGPVLLVLPLMLIRAVKANRAGRRFEAAVIFGFSLTLGSILLNFQGSTGVRNTSRLYSFLTLTLIYFVPLFWNWVSHRADSLRYTFAGLYLLAVCGGLVLFSAQVPAVQSPVLAPYMTELDAQISDKYWNTLPADTMVFDPLPYRAVTVFGRAVQGGLTWYEMTPDWTALYNHPDPASIHAAGYDYVYVDEKYWNSTTIPVQSLMKQKCVRPVESLKLWPGIIRKLFDVSGCIR